MNNETDPEIKQLDPRGLISEAYNIDGIHEADCRSIFFDWALGRTEAEGAPASVTALLSAYEPDFPDHPMTVVLRESKRAASTPRRKGGRKARLLDS